MSHKSTRPPGSFTVAKALRLLGMKRNTFGYLARLRALMEPTHKGHGLGAKTYLSRTNIYELAVIQKLFEFGLPTSTIKQIVQTRITAGRELDPSVVKTDGLKVTGLKERQVVWGPAKKGERRIEWSWLLEWAVSGKGDGPEDDPPRYLVITSDPDPVWRFFVLASWVYTVPLPFLLERHNPLFVLDLLPVLRQVDAKLDAK